MRGWYRASAFWTRNNCQPFRSQDAGGLYNIACYSSIQLLLSYKPECTNSISYTVGSPVAMRKYMWNLGPCDYCRLWEINVHSLRTEWKWLQQIEGNKTPRREAGHSMVHADTVHIAWGIANHQHPTPPMWHWMGIRALHIVQQATRGIPPSNMLVRCKQDHIVQIGMSWANVITLKWNPKLEHAAKEI